MNNLLGRILLIILSTMFLCGESIADSVVCLKGQACEYSEDKKIQTSLTGASLVVLGTFRLADSPAFRPLDDDIVLIDALLTVDRVYKGNIDVDALKLKVPIYRPPLKDPSNPYEPLDELAAAHSLGIQRLERDLEEGRIDKNRFDHELKTMRMKILNSRNYAEHKLILVPIQQGGIDNIYRRTDVLTEPGRPYVLFLFTDISKGGTTDVLPWNLDLYPDEKRPLIEKMLETTEE